ncbi:hypothetical protein [Gilliamella intestini]|uniref:Uncharacterized protein n=1 Tax=Gilliamella intestini TaxID=1798183 RepID=A0A1C4A4D2_9GAMM|nr:hypothetical protein [Gilliamella intestini]SCB89403.1 hypothetical protein GA0061080_100839 [Gilliamella intestini]
MVNGFLGIIEKIRVTYVNIAYEDHVNTLVAKICKPYLKIKKFRKYTVEEMENLAENFINDLDDLSQALFRELILFNWHSPPTVLIINLAASAAAGKRTCPIKELFKQADPSLKSMNVRELMLAIYSNSQKADEIRTKLQDKKCMAGSIQHAGVITNNHRNYFIERKNLQPFTFK